MTTYEPTRRPLRRPVGRSTRRHPPRSRGPSAAQIAVAIVLISVGYGLTLLPGIAAAGAVVLVPATILLLVGLDGSVRETLHEED